MCSSCAHPAAINPALPCPVPALLRPPHRLLNTVTGEYAAQQVFCLFLFFFFNSQQDQRDDGKTSAHLPLKAPQQNPRLILRLKPSHGNISSCVCHSRRLSSPAAECGHGDGTWISHMLVMPLTHLQMAANWHVTRL